MCAGQSVVYPVIKGAMQGDKCNMADVANIMKSMPLYGDLDILGFVF